MTELLADDLQNLTPQSEPLTAERRRPEPTSTVGRGKAYCLEGQPTFHHWSDAFVDLTLGDSIEKYADWPSPTVIVSDGAYGVLGFEGDTSDHTGMAEWYENHIKAWAAAATPGTTLWFWNSEIGWAAVHPVLEKYGFRYQNANIWNKGLAHIAGNVNTQKIRRFPVVTEICVQYVFEAQIDGKLLKRWLLDEWKRTGLSVRKANDACGVKDAAVRKYLDQGHLWYFPPPAMFQRMADYANEFGKAEGRPYFSRDGKRPMTGDEWLTLRPKFRCPHGITNVWDRNPLKGSERVTAPNGKVVHLNQKPIDLMQRIIEASSDPNDVVWEPFGGLFSASLAARNSGRRAFSSELDWTYFSYGVDRFRTLFL